MRIALSFLLSGLTILSACKKKTDDPAPQNEGAVRFDFVHRVDSQDLQFNTFSYTNIAGNPYKVTRLEYYVSKIVFEREDGSVYDANMYHYIDAKDAGTLEVAIDHIPAGTYTQVRFILGVDSARNVPFGLDNNTINTDMEWPVELGGGYHFMRFEGLFTDTAGQNKGYAIHLGATPHQAEIVLANSGITISAGDQWHYKVEMNLNNWFKAPNLIDLNDDYSSIMADEAAQQKFSQNARQVFSLAGTAI
jgi:hypothetical protein